MPKRPPFLAAFLLSKAPALPPRFLVVLLLALSPQKMQGRPPPVSPPPVPMQPCRVAPSLKFPRCSRGAGLPSFICLAVSMAAIWQPVRAVPLWGFAQSAPQVTEGRPPENGPGINRAPLFVPVWACCQWSAGVPKWGTCSPHPPHLSPAGFAAAVGPALQWPGGDSWRPHRL